MATVKGTRLASVTARDGIDTRNQDLIVAPNDKGELSAEEKGTCQWCKREDAPKKILEVNFDCCSQKCYDLAFKRWLRESSKPRVPANEEEEMECPDCQCGVLVKDMVKGLCKMCELDHRCESSARECRRCGRWGECWC